MSVNNFDVMKAMAAAEKDIRLAPLNNITNLQKTKRGTLITIGVEGDVVAAIGLEGRFVGGLILADKVQFNDTKAVLAEALDPLLDALRKTLAAAVELHAQNIGCPDCPPEARDLIPECPMLRAADAAIAKATGR